MAKTAVDVALLLTPEVNDVCIAINQAEGSVQTSDLSKPDNHPHITLAMGVIDEAQVPEVNERIKKIAARFHKLELKFSALRCPLNPDNKPSCVFDVTVTPELRALHEAVMREVAPLFTHDPAQDMFHVDSDEEFSAISMRWVANYALKHSGGENYNPHVSLKCRKAEYPRLPITFAASKIALCHLGNRCTCRTILGSADLG